MRDASLQIHIEMKDGAIARVSPEALNDPAFIDAMNAMIAAAGRAAAEGSADGNGEAKSGAGSASAKSSDLRTETVEPASSANRRFAATPGSANVSGAPQQSGAGGEREEKL